MIAEFHNKSLHQTKPLVTHLADAKSAPIVFAGEANVEHTNTKEACHDITN